MERLLVRLFAEGLGTFFLCCAVGLTYYSLPEGGGPAYVGATLFAAMGVTGFVSGAMFNPAVTTGVIVHKALTQTLGGDLKELLLCYVVQMVCGWFGGLVAWGLDEQTFQFMPSDIPHAEGRAFMAEMIWTSLLVGSALMVGKTTNSSLLAGLAVVLSVTSGGFLFGGISGGGFNPAVAFGVSFSDMINTGTYWKHWWLYIIAPLLGGVIGGIVTTIMSIELKHARETVYTEGYDKLASK